MFLKPRWHVPVQNLVKCLPGGIACSKFATHGDSAHLNIVFSIKRETIGGEHQFHKTQKVWLWEDSVLDVDQENV